MISKAHEKTTKQLSTNSNYNLLLNTLRANEEAEKAQSSARLPEGVLETQSQEQLGKMKAGSSDELALVQTKADETA